MQSKQSTIVKRIVDVLLTVLLLCLMAYQVTGEKYHEWIGIGMTILVIVHQILNRKWYKATFKGKYNPYRILTLVVNIGLFSTFALTAFCGMSMSSHAVPFLYGMTKLSFARKMHLAMSYWAFVLMGIHLGLHIPAMTSKLKIPDKGKIVIFSVMCIVAGAGLYYFLKNNIADYMFFKTPFAFLDYEKAAAMVFLENILILSFWAYTGTWAALICKKIQKKKE